MAWAIIPLTVFVWLIFYPTIFGKKDLSVDTLDSYYEENDKCATLTWTYDPVDIDILWVRCFYRNTSYPKKRESDTWFHVLSHRPEPHTENYLGHLRDRARAVIIRGAFHMHIYRPTTADEGVYMCEFKHDTSGTAKAMLSLSKEVPLQGAIGSTAYYTFRAESVRLFWRFYPTHATIYKVSCKFLKSSSQKGKHVYELQIQERSGRTVGSFTERLHHKLNKTSGEFELILDSPTFLDEGLFRCHFFAAHDTHHHADSLLLGSGYGTLEPNGVSASGRAIMKIVTPPAVFLHVFTMQALIWLLMVE